MNILVIRPGAIGDALLTFPALHALRAKYAARHVTITFVSNAKVLPLARHWKLADDVSDFENAEWSELFSTAGIHHPRLRQVAASTDMVICWLSDPDHLVENNLRQAGVKNIIIAPGRPPDTSDLHVTEYLASTAGLSKKQVRSWEPPSGPIDKQAAGKEKNRAVAIHPGSGSERKCWPIDLFADIITTLWRANYPVLLLAGPAEEQRLAYLHAHLEPPPGLYRELVNAPLLEIVQQLRQCRGYLGNDSGVTHLAAMLGTPTLAIFGPSVKIAHWEPRGKNVVLLHQPNLNFLTPLVVKALMQSIFQLRLL